MLQGLCILRHKEDSAFSVISDLVGELIETIGVGKVDIRVWLQPMTIASGDEHNTPFLSQSNRFPVLCPIAQSIQLNCVDPCPVFAQKFLHQMNVQIFSNSIQIPHRVIEDHKNFGLGV